MDKQCATPAQAGRLFLLRRAILLPRILLGILTFLAGAGGVQGVYGAERDSEAARLTATINERLAKLDLNRRAAESTFDKALQARKAIQMRDYLSARKIIADVLAGSRLQNWRFHPFETFMNGISDTKDPGFEALLHDWFARDRNDPIPALIRAQFHLDLGWLKRGRKFAQETRGDQLAAFTTYMTKALAEVNEAINLDGRNPYTFFLKLRILHGFGVSQELQSAFEEAVAKHPLYYPLYEIVLSTLEPRWGGTPAAMYAFVDLYAGSAPEHSPLKLLYISLYRRLLTAASIACTNQRSNKDKLSQCIASYMGRHVTPELERRIPKGLQLYDHVEKHQFNVAIEEILLEMLRTSGADAYSGALLQLAASAMHSDTQINKEGPDRNSYVIDKAVAESWYQKAFYENALAKFRQSLKNVDAAAFPDNDEKNLAIAAIYARLARTHNMLHQYVDLIVYGRAAVALGGFNGDEHLICYGYHKLQLYEEGIGACAGPVDQADNLSARYWRGLLYRDADQAEAALRDLRIVADSENGFRTSAAISMSVIYDKRQDFRGSLEVLNKYTFLYNENTQRKEDLAVVYNNRCFAYKELGDLKKALDDCTASLKYGSLPDAYRKQQELIRLLKRPDKDL